MPIYEFQCDDCEQVFEQMRRITDDTLPGCPACESGNVRKLISLSAFHLKGTGWYVTDYGGKKNGATAVDGSEDKGDSSHNGSNGGDDNGKTSGSADSKAAEPKGEKADSTAPKSSTAAKEVKPSAGDKSTSSK